MLLTADPSLWVTWIMMAIWMLLLPTIIIQTWHNQDPATPTATVTPTETPTITPTSTSVDITPTPMPIPSSGPGGLGVMILMLSGLMAMLGNKRKDQF